jgi:hypothetical protein
MKKFDYLRFGMALLLLAVGLTMSGCATTEAENASARPWNSPAGWEGGMPGGFYERSRR